MAASAALGTRSSIYYGCWTKRWTFLLISIGVFAGVWIHGQERDTLRTRKLIHFGRGTRTVLSFGQKCTWRFLKLHCSAWVNMERYTWKLWELLPLCTGTNDTLLFRAQQRSSTPDCTPPGLLISTSGTRDALSGEKDFVWNISPPVSAPWQAPLQLIP